VQCKLEYAFLSCCCSVSCMFITLDTISISIQTSMHIDHCNWYTPTVDDPVLRVVSGLQCMSPYAFNVGTQNWKQFSSMLASQPCNLYSTRYPILIPCSILVGKGKGSPYNRPWGPKRGSRGIVIPVREPRHEEGMGWVAPRPGRFTPGKETRYPLYRRLGGPQGQSGRMRKISPPPGFDPQTVQPVASRYTDCAFPALLNA
jgi:hypothetical protein